MHSPHLRSRKLYSSFLREEYLHILLVLKGYLSTFSCLIICSITYLYQYKLMYIYFYFRLSSNAILLILFLNFSTSDYWEFFRWVLVPLWYISIIVFVCLFVCLALSYILALKEAPGISWIFLGLTLETRKLGWTISSRSPVMFSQSVCLIGEW